MFKGTYENANKSETNAKSARASSTASFSRTKVEEKGGENDMVPCKICKKAMAKKSLLRHIGQTKICKELYGKEFDDMKAEKTLKSQAQYDQVHKDSISVRKKAHYSQNSESIKVKQTSYNSQNKDKIKTRQRAYHSQHREEINARQTAYNTEHREDINARQTEYNTEHREEINARQTVYNTEHREEINARQTVYNTEHREEINEKQNIYNTEHKEEIKSKQKIQRTKKQMNMKAEDRIKAFRKDIIEGPNFTCFSCKRCLFKKSVRIIKSKDLPKILEKLDSKFLQRIGLKQNRLKKKTWQFDLILCHNCLKLIRKGKVPKIHFSNGLWLDKVPAELELKDLEQQLIARSLLFMKVKKLPTSRMKAMFDNVIIVPIEQDDVSKNISELPRHPDDAKIVAVTLKRKLEYKNSHLQEFIRPAKCLKAIQKLKELGNPFYENVSVNENFMEKEEVSLFYSLLKCVFLKNDFIKSVPLMG